MDINTKLIIKVQFNDEIRKMPIHNEDITYDELIIMMERVFKNKLNAEDEIIIKYKDEDNDLITISDDSDLAFAIESSNILKLSLTIENNVKEEEKKNDLTSSDTNTIRKELQRIRDQVNRLLDKLVLVNGDSTANVNLSGRASAIEGKDFQEIGGKEFDPLSVSDHHTHYPITERTETSSILSNSRKEEVTLENNRPNISESHSEPKESHENSPAKNQNMMTSMPHNIVGQPQMQPMVNNTSSNMAYNQNKMPPTLSGQNMPPNMNRQTMSPIMPPHSIGQNLPPNMGSQNLPHNMGGQNMPPNIGGSNMPPNMGGQNLPPNMGGQNLPPNMGGQNLPPNMGGQNMPPTMGGQNMPPNMGGPNMPPNMGGQNMPPNMGGQNMPPNMGGQNMPPTMGGPNMPPMISGAPPNMSSTVGNSGPNIAKADNPMHSTAPSAFTGNQPPMMSQLQNQRPLYPNAMQPPRLSPSNFQGPGTMGNPGSALNRPQGYMYGQNSQFNPAISQPNMNYGYQPSQN